uniref:Transmembrane and coiled-coil domain-containing protein 4 n=1 Tax=Panagrolaimus sp. JU765 TaxID=591449 RepID=A0AC34RGP2_9BILA
MNEQCKKFSHDAIELVIRYCDLPEKTNNALRQHLDNEGGNNDIASLIMSIKSDPYIQRHSGIILMGSLLMMVMEKGDYDCRYRVLLRHIGALLGISWDDFEDMEDTLTDCLINDQYIESDETRTEREKTARMKKIKRYASIAAAGSVGGILIGLTGGLAAPFIATGVGAVIGGGAAAGIATTAGSAVLGSAFGVAGAGLAGYKMKKRVGAIEEFAIETLSDENSLHVVLCVSGWIDDNTDKAFKQQWRHLWMSKEQYTLRYESKYLIELGKAIDYLMSFAYTLRYESKYLIELGKAIDYLMSFAVSYAIQHTLMETALAGLVSAIAWPVALLSASSVLDNPWNVCISRATEVGEHLADILLARQHGKRPITLIGFSLGARVIYHCLLAMSRRPDCVGIIEDVVLLGAPVSASPKQWRQMCTVVGGRVINGYCNTDWLLRQMCTVVGGRVINGYCNTDWLLRFLYRTMNVQFTIAGTGPVDNRNERKIVNFNLSHIVKGHMDYSKRLTEVLDAVGVKVTPRSRTSDEDLQKYEQEQQKMEIAEEAMENVVDEKIKEKFSQTSV